MILPFFLLSESCVTEPNTTIIAIAYNLNDRNYIFYVNGSYYIPFYMEDTNMSDEKIKTLFPDATVDTIFFYNENVCVQPKAASIFYANNIMCITTSPVCDAYINKTLMYVNVHDKDDGNHCATFSLLSEELLLIAFLKDRLQRERQSVFIDTIDINESSCNYQYMFFFDSIEGGKQFFVSGNNPNEPTSCTMLSEFILSLVQKHLTNIHQNNDKIQYDYDNFIKIRIMLEQLEKDYHIAPQIPVWEDIQSNTRY